MISIIIPVYDGEKFIDSAIQQILQQCLESFEIIFVDNNSKDNSLKILQAHAQKDSRIKVFAENKQGAGAARNSGVRQAKGDYIYFFDVDDFLVQGALELMRNTLENNPETSSVFGESLKVKTRNVQEYTDLNATYSVKKAPYWGIEWFGNFSKLTGTPSFLHRKSVFQEIGYFPEEIKVGEDAFFHIKLGLNLKIINLNQVVFLYYRHSNSTVSRNNRNSSRDQIYWNQYITIYIPYYRRGKTPQAFKVLLHKKLFASVFKLLIATQGFKKRVKLSTQLLNEMEPIKLPFLFKMYMWLIILTRSNSLYKFFAFYILPFYRG
ncbi:glycosyltransferase family A protein [Mesonia ostreae]|uniref:Glycosyltransferase family A protein n=1 Tax=Mesonia ostreae TaxID=861110 RepID=A0ABU2KM08_9FLAO|nr:glycosyltransferase family A protein [Mesonia ostreae]MDT0295735.1 glycosyltransferase family A protein [Mesonia ostreae]